MKNLNGIYLAILLALLPLLKLEAQNHNEFYYEIIATPDKTIDFTVGVYPRTLKYVESGPDGSGYSTLEMAVINQRTAKDFFWNDYKVYILLKDGTLFYNYTTKAQSGDFACNYTVKTGDKNIQVLCFARRFNIQDIDKVWLMWVNGKFFPLVYHQL